MGYNIVYYMESQKNLSPIINFIWSVADDVLVHAYKKGKYGDVILPMTVIRRLDLVLEPTNDRVQETYNEYKNRLDNLDFLLTSEKDGSGKQFYNTSKFTLKSLLNDPKNIRSNFENYLDGFSPNVQDIISKFKFRNQLETLENDEDDVHLLFQLIEKFVSPKVDLHPDRLSNHQMGYVFEDLVRRFNEENNEEAGEHFTPREIIELMTNIVFLPVKDKLKQGSYLVYDPCSGSGGMLTESRNFINNVIGSDAVVHLYGQEVQPETYATSKSDFLIKGDDPDKIGFGSTLTNDRFPDIKFDFMLTNPPYGKSWKDDKAKLGVGPKGAILDPRFQWGVPGVGDGQLMFLQHMISKMKSESLIGSRIASVHNASALMKGDAGSGESEIRRHIIENDLLECVISLPRDIFYNTNIETYIFILSNKKSPDRKGKVQLINALDLFKKLPKPLGKKRKELSNSDLQAIINEYLSFKTNTRSLILDNHQFGYKKVTATYLLKNKDRLKIIEKVPIAEDIREYIERHSEYGQYLESIDEKRMKIGYEIPLKRFFYELPEHSKVTIKKDVDLSIQKVKRSLIKDKIDTYFSAYLKAESVQTSNVFWLPSAPDSWRPIKAKYIFKEVSVKGLEEKELLSVTQDLGVIPRNELDQDVMNPGDDVSSYKLVKKGQFVISLRSFQGGLEYSQYEGIVSPAYTVFENFVPINDAFYRYLFKSHAFIQALSTLVSGIRDGQNIRFQDLGELTLPYPDIDEQNLIADTLSDTKKIDDLLTDITEKVLLQLESM